MFADFDYLTFCHLSLLFFWPMKTPIWITWHFGPNPPYLSRYGSTSPRGEANTLSQLFSLAWDHINTLSRVGEVFAEYVYDQHSLTIGSKYCFSRSHAATQLEHHGIVRVSFAMACKSHSGNLNHWQNSFFFSQKSEYIRMVRLSRFLVDYVC